MEPVDHLIAVVRGWVIIAVMTCVGALGGFVTGVLEAPSFRSTATVLLVPAAESEDTELGPVTSFMNSQVQSYAELVSSPVVLDAVTAEESLGISAGELASRVEAEVPVDTLVIDVSVVDTDPARAAALANATAGQLQDAVAQLAPDGASGAPTVELRSVGQAQPPVSAESPRKLLRLLVGAGLGLFLGVLVAVARHAVRLRHNQEQNAKAHW